MLDARKRAYKFGRGRRVPKLKRTQGSPRDQKQIHLTGGEAMDFALARCERARTTEGPQRPRWQRMHVHACVLYAFALTSVARARCMYTQRGDYRPDAS